MSVRLTLITVTSMQIVRIPWVHIPVRAVLGIPETDKLAVVKNRQQANKQTNKQSIKHTSNLTKGFSVVYCV